MQKKQKKLYESYIYNLCKKKRSQNLYRKKRYIYNLFTKLCICCSNFSVENEKEKSEHSASGLSLDASPGGSPGRAPGRNAPAAVDQDGNS